MPTAEIYALRIEIGQLKTELETLQAGAGSDATSARVKELSELIEQKEAFLITLEGRESERISG